MADKNKLGVLLFLASEAIFFLILILSFIYFRDSWINEPSPNPGGNLNILFTGIFSIALWGSSGTVWFAERSSKHGNSLLLKLGLAATIILGATFLIGQGLEYDRLLQMNVTISQNLFGTTFFTLTGFHGFHVLIGLTILTILLGLTLAGGPNAPGANAVGAVALYWHFVDLVWVVIFSIVYVWTLVLL
jgi:heme/copper-type cytochrome/quinol oxidase subunit 3